MYESNTRRRQQEKVRKYLTMAGLILLVLLTFLGYRTYNIYQSELPSFKQLHNIEPSLKTKLYDRNGILIQEFYSENRILTPYKNIPPHLVEMLLAVEDRQFFDHWGINLRRLATVAVTNIVKWRIEGGASTITQQLSRMIFLTRKQTFERKIKEALTAIKLERTYSKEEILEMYLNQYYFSRGAYGVAAAARLLFSKEAHELNLNDCAILIGMLKGPNINSPLNNPDKSLQARNRVLFSYYDVGGLTRALYDSL
ncbi:MAG: transglycosylase domain-containing protein, partial [candidate division Zixibacteria bacterium]|nr:transglycosylase domain-containing protein [candidate division Zixibacteria bacterium]